MLDSDQVDLDLDIYQPAEKWNEEGEVCLVKLTGVTVDIFMN